MMRLESSLITRRTFLNTLLGGWLTAFGAGSFYALARFVFPASGKEPDFVVLKTGDFLSIRPNSVKSFPWGGKMGLFLKRSDGSMTALKGVCTHMECNVTYRPEDRKFYCPCHKGWFDDQGKNMAGPPPKPLEIFELIIEGEKLIVAKKNVRIEPATI